MYTHVLRPVTLTGPELDDLLAQGWYRMGPALFTCRYTALDDGVLRTAIWSRTVLEDFTFRRSHRKALGRIDRRFRIENGPAVIDEAHRELHARYLTVAPGERSEDLSDVLFGHQETAPFDTREIALWEGDRLAAFSWFDVGERSVMSLMGCYDPDLASESLGFGTLLLELRLAREQGRRYHYSGYILPGAPVMDYKLRLATELYEPVEDRWLPVSALQDWDLFTDRIDRALGAAHTALMSHGLTAEIGRYRYSEVQAWNPNLPPMLTHPVVLACGPWNGGLVMVAWDDLDGHYEVLRCRPARFQTSTGADLIAMLIVEAELAQVPEARQLPGVLRALGIGDEDGKA